MKYFIAWADKLIKHVPATQTASLGK
jgi:hypothetical protein